MDSETAVEYMGNMQRIRRNICHDTAFSTM